MTYRQHPPGTPRVMAEWFITTQRYSCAVCHVAKPQGSQMMRVSQHPGSNQPWATSYICAECAPSVEANMGSAYPGPPPAQ